MDTCICVYNVGLRSLTHYTIYTHAVGAGSPRIAGEQYVYELSENGKVCLYVSFKMSFKIYYERDYVDDDDDDDEVSVRVLMRDEKEGRKKRARSNKQQDEATRYTQGSQFS